MSVQLEHRVTDMSSYASLDVEKYSDIGSQELQKGDVNRAFEAYEYAFKKSRELDNSYLERACAFNLGAAYIAKGQPIKGLELLQKAVPPLNKRDGRSNGDLYFNFALGYEALMKYQDAIKYYKLALDEYKVENYNDSMEIETAQKVAQLCASLGYHKDAALYFSHLAGVYKRQNNTNKHVLTLSETANQLLLTGNLSEAEKQAEECFLLCESCMQNSDLGNTYNDLGLLYTQCQNYESATQCFEKALPIIQTTTDSGKQTAVILQNIGAIYNFRGDYQRSISFHERAAMMHAKQNGRQSQGQCFANLAFAFSQIGDNESAREAFLHALQAAKDTDDRRSQWQVLEGLGAVSFIDGNVGKSIKYFQNALGILALAEETEDAQQRIVGKLTHSIEVQISHEGSLSNTLATTFLDSSTSLGVTGRSIGGRLSSGREDYEPFGLPVAAAKLRSKSRRGHGSRDIYDPDNLTPTNELRLRQTDGLENPTMATLPAAKLKANSKHDHDPGKFFDPTAVAITSSKLLRKLGAVDREWILILNRQADSQESLRERSKSMKYKEDNESDDPTLAALTATKMRSKSLHSYEPDINDPTMAALTAAKMRSQSMSAEGQYYDPTAVALTSSRVKSRSKSNKTADEDLDPTVVALTAAKLRSKSRQIVEGSDFMDPIMTAITAAELKIKSRGQEFSDYNQDPTLTATKSRSKSKSNKTADEDLDPTVVALTAAKLRSKSRQIVEGSDFMDPIMTAITAAELKIKSRGQEFSDYNQDPTLTATKSKPNSRQKEKSEEYHDPTMAAVTAAKLKGNSKNSKEFMDPTMAAVTGAKMRSKQAEEDKSIDPTMAVLTSAKMRSRPAGEDEGIDPTMAVLTSAKMRSNTGNIENEEYIDPTVAAITASKLRSRGQLEYTDPTMTALTNAKMRGQSKQAEDEGYMDPTMAALTTAKVRSHTEDHEYIDPTMAAVTGAKLRNHSRHADQENFDPTMAVLTGAKLRSDKTKHQEEDYTDPTMAAMTAAKLRTNSTQERGENFDPTMTALTGAKLKSKDKDSDNDTHNAYDPTVAALTAAKLKSSNDQNGEFDPTTVALTKAKLSAKGSSSGGVDPTEFAMAAARMRFRAIEGKPDDTFDPSTVALTASKLKGQQQEETTDEDDDEYETEDEEDSSEDDEDEGEVEMRLQDSTEQRPMLNANRRSYNQREAEFGTGIHRKEKTPVLLTTDTIEEEEYRDALQRVHDEERGNAGNNTQQTMQPQRRRYADEEASESEDEDDDDDEDEDDDDDEDEETGDSETQHNDGQKAVTVRTYEEPILSQPVYSNDDLENTYATIDFSAKKKTGGLYDMDRDVTFDSKNLNYFEVGDKDRVHGQGDAAAGASSGYHGDETIYQSMHPPEQSAEPVGRLPLDSDLPRGEKDRRMYEYQQQQNQKRNSDIPELPQRANKKSSACNVM